MLSGLGKWFTFAFWRLRTSLEYLGAGLEGWKAQAIVCCACCALMMTTIFTASMLRQCDVLGDRPFLLVVAVAVCCYWLVRQLPARFTKHEPEFQTYSARARAIGTAVIVSFVIAAFVGMLWTATMARPYAKTACEPLFGHVSVLDHP